ncbi:lysozyme, partial [Salmonella enterica subsp. enterica serovar Cerro]
LNLNNYQAAADAFLLWKKAGNDPDILLPRRQRERALFLS